MMIAPPVNKLQEMAESETPPRVKPEHNKKTIQLDAELLQP